MLTFMSRELIHQGADTMAAYLAENYCPTLDKPDKCPDDLAAWFPKMEAAVVNQFISSPEAALHMCQSMGVCKPRE